MENVGEKFPSFEDSQSEDRLHTVISPQEISPSSKTPPVKNWPVRKASQRGWETRNCTVQHTSKHHPKRSVSEAFDNFRQRRGSITANTQELAEALKAPVSYKLVVSNPTIRNCNDGVDTCIGAVHRLVYDVGSDEHILEIYIKCLSEARYVDDRPIRVCVIMVYNFRLPGFRLPWAENSHTRTKEWNQIPVQGSYCYCDASSSFPTPGPSSQLNRHI
jgi:hypothetical protein